MTIAIAKHRGCGTEVIGKRVDGELKPYCPTCQHVVYSCELTVKAPLTFLFASDEQRIAEVEAQS